MVDVQGNSKRKSSRFDQYIEIRSIRTYKCSHRHHPSSIYYLGTWAWVLMQEKLEEIFEILLKFSYFELWLWLLCELWWLLEAEC